MPSVAGFLIFIELPLLVPLLPHLKKEKGSTEYDLKTSHAGNTIKTTVIAILESSLTAAAINCVLLFLTYLLVPRKRLFPGCVFLAITFTCIFRVLFASSLFNLKNENHK